MSGVYISTLFIYSSLAFDVFILVITSDRFKTINASVISNFKQFNQFHGISFLLLFFI